MAGMDRDKRARAQAKDAGAGNTGERDTRARNAGAASGTTSGSKSKRTSKKASRRMKGTLAMAGVAAALLLASGVGGTRAALTYFSDTYKAQMEVQNIGVTLVETDGKGNSKDVDYRNYDYTKDNNNWIKPTEDGKLLTTMLSAAGDKNVVIGKKYDEILTARNSGQIDEYVRVIVTKYWVDEDGNKDVTVSPNLIDLNITDSNGWVVDTSAGSTERTVLYYTKILPVGETTPAFTDTLAISSSVTNKVTKESVTQEDGYIVTTTTYEYDGKQFVIEAEVDAVQTHNAADAIKSAWGVDVNVAADGSFTLK